MPVTQEQLTIHVHNLGKRPCISEDSALPKKNKYKSIH